MRLRNYSCGATFLVKSCGIVIAEVPPSNCEIAIADLKKSRACPPQIYSQKWALLFWTVAELLWKRYYNKFEPPFPRVKEFGALQVIHIKVLALSDQNFKTIQKISFETQHEWFSANVFNETRTSIQQYRQVQYFNPSRRHGILITSKLSKFENFPRTCFCTDRLQISAEKIAICTYTVKKTFSYFVQKLMIHVEK